MATRMILLQFLSDSGVKTRPRFQGQDSGMKIFPHHLLYHMLKPKSQEKILVAPRSLRVLKILLFFSDRVPFRAHSDSVLFIFLGDWVFFRFLSDRVLFKSSVIGSSKGYSVIDSSIGLSVLFFQYAGTFLSKGTTTFFIKNRCSVLHYIFKKTFTLNNQFNML